MLILELNLLSREVSLALFFLFNSGADADSRRPGLFVLLRNFLVLPTLACVKVTVRTTLQEQGLLPLALNK